MDRRYRGDSPCAIALMDIAHPKTNIRRTFLEKLCFDFMADIIAIKPGFREQVAAEAIKNVPKRAKSVFLDQIVRGAWVA